MVQNDEAASRAWVCLEGFSFVASMESHRGTAEAFHPSNWPVDASLEMLYITSVAPFSGVVFFRFPL